MSNRKNEHLRKLELFLMLGGAVWPERAFVVCTGEPNYVVAAEFLKVRASKVERLQSAAKTSEDVVSGTKSVRRVNTQPGQLLLKALLLLVSLVSLEVSPNSHGHVFRQCVCLSGSAVIERIVFATGGEDASSWCLSEMLLCRGRSGSRNPGSIQSNWGNAQTRKGRRRQDWKG